MSFVSLLRGVSERRHRALATVALAALIMPATAAMGGVVAGTGTSESPEGSTADSERGGAVWVVNREAGEVAIFDAGTGELLARQPTGAGAHDVTISDNAHSAYVTNESDDTISIVSTDQLDATTVDLGPKPHHVEVSRDGATIAVGLFGTNAVALIDTDTGRTENYTSSANPAAAAHGIYLLDDTLYVAHETGDEVTAVDTATGDIVFSVDGITEPSEVLPDASAQLLYVSARGEDAIKIIDLNTHSIVGEVQVGDQPEGLLLTGDQRTLIVSMRGTPARLAFIDTRTLAVTELVDLAGADTSGDLAAISDDDRFVYATFDRGETGTGGVAVVDVDRRAVIDTWTYPGVGRVHGIAYTTQTPTSTDNAQLEELESTLEALWTTVLETPSAENAFGTGGAAYACWDLGGTVSPFGGNVESCTVKPGTRLFIEGYSVECSTFEGNGTTEAELRTCARKSDEQLAPTITVDGEPVPLAEAETPLMHIVLPADNLFGQPEGTEGLSVGHGWVAFVDPLPPGTHTIDGVYANGEPAFTTTIIVEPDQTDATTTPT